MAQVAPRPPSTSGAGMPSCGQPREPGSARLPGEERSLRIGEDSSSDESEADRHQLARGTGVQARRSRWRAVPEYREKLRTEVSAGDAENLGRLKAAARLGWG